MEMYSYLGRTDACTTETLPLYTTTLGHHIANGLLDGWHFKEDPCLYSGLCRSPFSVQFDVSSRSICSDIPSCTLNRAMEFDQCC